MASKKLLQVLKCSNTNHRLVSYSRFRACANLFRQVSPLNSRQQQSRTLATTDAEDALKKRQAEMMARGLPKKKPIAGVRDVVLVVSGKGGVGKSTSAVNVATALAEQNHSKIGLLDADVFGPSVPLMMNLLKMSPEVNQHNQMIPLLNYGVKCMSMGFLVSETSAVIWRGLMVMKALEQMTRQVDWSDTECLIVDTPPGTGDSILSLVQTIPIAGVVMVTTPEKLAVQVARRGGTMLQKLGIPIIGIVNNMSSVVCHNCQTDIPIFGTETEKLASDLGVPILADIPLCNVRSEGSTLKPAVIDDHTSQRAEQYRNIGKRIRSFLEVSRSPT